MPENIQNYSERISKNKSKKFKLAIEEIELAINEQNNDEPITLKNIPMSELISTFCDHEENLRSIFNERRQMSDHLNRGNGYDHVTILWRTLEDEQQKNLFRFMRDSFVENYYQNPIVRNINSTVNLIDVPNMTFL